MYKTQLYVNKRTGYIDHVIYYDISSLMADLLDYQQSGKNCRVYELTNEQTWRRIGMLVYPSTDTILIWIDKNITSITIEQ